MPVGSPLAIQRWVNEGGSLAPGDKASARNANRARGQGKEARDTVAGCRARAAKDCLHAATADTENGRRVFERSAASWEVRGHEIQERDDASAQQRAVDRSLWASGEGDDSASAY